MSEVHVHRVQPAWKKNALIDNDTYLKWYADSVKNPDKFWGKHGKRIDWFLSLIHISEPTRPY